jgi:AraC family transcriptional activator of pobA
MPHRIALSDHQLQSGAMTENIPSYRLYRERTGETADFWLHGERIPQRTRLHNWEIATHRHPAFLQIFHVTAGHGDILDAGCARSFRAPAAFFIPPGRAHGFRFSRDIDGYVVTALADRLATLSAGDRQTALFAEEIRIVPLEGLEPCGVQPAECLIRLAEEIEGRSAGRAIVLEALVTITMMALVRQWTSTAAAPHLPANRDLMRLDQLEALIGVHLRERRPIGFYADRLGISAAQLNRIARATTGLSIQRLIARHLIEAARRELVFTARPVAHIAASLGFADPAYFNRFFRRHAGMTPGAFRNAQRHRFAGPAPI